MTAELTAQETYDSLTGFEEIAIRKHFGMAVNELDKFTIGRALVFAHKRRDGLKDPEAYEAALAMTRSEVQEFFPAEADEPMPEDPETEQGKDS